MDNKFKINSFANLIDVALVFFKRAFFLLMLQMVNSEIEIAT